jgi:type IV pilus assembly protein PilW
MRNAMKMSRHMQFTQGPKRVHSGFSLVELMISITLGLMVLTALAAIFANTSTTRSELERVHEQIDNARYAVDVLSQDLQLAGYYGELAVSGLPVPGALPDPCALTAADWSSAIPIAVQGYDEGAGVPACVPGSLKAGTDVIVVRRLRPCIAGAASCDPVVATEPYMQVALCSSSATPYKADVGGGGAFTLTQKDCATPAGLRRYQLSIYFISNDNGAGVNVPTLKRLDFNGATFTETPLVEGIERLHVEYGLDTNGDGSPDAYTSDPTNFTYAGCTTCTASNNWSNAMTAKIYVLARTLEASAGFTDNKTYQLGLAADGTVVTAGPFNDGFRRHVYSAAVRLMNPSGRRDTP